MSTEQTTMPMDLDTTSTGEVFQNIGHTLVTLTELLAELAKRNGCNPPLGLLLSEDIASLTVGTKDSAVSSPRVCGWSKLKQSNKDETHKTTNLSVHSLQDEGQLDLRRREHWATCDTSSAQIAVAEFVKKPMERCSSVLSEAPRKISAVEIRTSLVERSRGVYASAAARLRLACGCVLHPQSLKRLVWDVISACFIMHGLVTMPLVVFDMPFSQSSVVIQWVAAFFWTCDVGVNFRTGYYTGDKIEMRGVQVAKHYSNTWLIPDIGIASSEWVLVHFVSFGTGLSGGRVSRVAKIVKLIRALRVLKLVSVLMNLEAATDSNTVRLSFHLLKVSTLLLLAVHFLCCGWYAVGKEDGWVGRLQNSEFWSHYLASARWTLAQINGRTDQQHNRTTVEQLYVCVCSMFAILIMSLFVSSITAGIMQLRGIMDEQTKSMRALNAFISKHKVSWNVAYFAKQHIKNTQMRTSDRSVSNVLSLLPQQLQTELLFEARSPILVKHAFFRCLAAQNHCIRSLCAKTLTSTSATATEVVFERGDTGEHMLFVESGDLKYSACEDLKHQMKLWAGSEIHQKKLGRMLTISDSSTLHGKLDGQKVASGMWLSEAALWLDWRHRGELIATRICHLMELHASAFADVVKQYPSVWSLCGLYSGAFYQMMCETDEPSDLLIGFPPPSVEFFCSRYMASEPANIYTYAQPAGSFQPISNATKEFGTPPETNLEQGADCSEDGHQARLSL